MFSRRIIFIALLSFSIPISVQLLIPLVYSPDLSAETQQAEINQALQLTGMDELKISILQGAPKWETDRQKEMFQGAKWVFHNGNNFSFTPSSSANVRKDLFPISGTYAKKGNTIEFRGERQSSGSRASIDGFIHTKPEKTTLDLLYTVSAPGGQRIVRITQDLSESTSSVTNISQIEKIPVPSTFRISLQGQTAQPFGSLPATLEILPASSPDPNPFFVKLSTDSLENNGSLVWQSYFPAQSGIGELSSKITRANGQVRLEVNSSQEPVRLDVNWFTVANGQLGEVVENLPVGAGANNGTMTFRISGDRISGQISIAGTSDLGQPSTYQAEFTGEKTENSQSSVQNTNPPPEEASLFNSQWNTTDFGKIQLKQEGIEVSGTYKDEGTIKGVVRGSRLDFTWFDPEKGEGWGFFREVPGARTLAGMYGYNTDKTKSESIVANWKREDNPLPNFNPGSMDKIELRDLGFNLYIQNKCPQALQPLEIALKLYQKEIDNPETWEYLKHSDLISQLNIHNNLSFCYFRLEEYDNLLGQLINVLELRLKIEQIDYLKPFNEILQSNFTNYLERWRQKLNDDLEKIAVLEEAQEIFQKLMEALVGVKNEEEALLVSETARARAFADLLAERISSKGEQRITVNLPKIELLQQIAKEKNATLVEYSIICENFKCEEKGRESKLYIWVINPNGKIDFQEVNLKQLQQQNTSLSGLVSNVRESIKKGVVVGRSDGQINFAVGDRIRLRDDDEEDPAWEVVSVDPQRGMLTLRLPSFAPGETIEVPTTDVTGKVDSSSSPHAKNPYLQELHQLLIEPIAHLLPTDSSTRVIFIPQGSLLLVPFSALQDTAGNYLIEKHTILTTPAIQLLDLTRQAGEKVQENPAPDVLIVGNPTMPKTDTNGKPIDVIPLPEAEREAIAIAEFFNTEPLIGDRASKAAILPRIETARIIHLATHGKLDKDDPKVKKIPGAIALGASATDNGWLTADEIWDLKLNAELVVLSACDTARGDIKGDGVIGLSRSLITAGVPSVVVSLWQVPDAPTSDLMKEFYHQMQKQNQDKAQALRQAMLTAIEQSPDPKNWAAFTLIGEAE